MSRDGPSWRSEGRLGDKLGPRLARLWVDSTVRSRAILAPWEARVRQAGTQALIDRAGREVAELYAPIVHELLRTHPDKNHPHIEEFLRTAASGRHQWQALAGLAAGGVSGGLGSVFANALAPVVYQINRHSPNLDLDAQTAAAAAVAGIVTTGDAISTAADQGYQAGEARTLMDLATHVPEQGMLWQLVNRGDMDAEEALMWLHRQGFPASTRAGILGLRHQLLAPADLALAVLRGEMTASEGERIAAKSGVSAADFRVLEANTGEPLGLMQLLEAYRRGIIDKKRLERGIRQSRVRDEWIPTATALRYEPVPTADAVDAALRGHISWSEAEKVAERNGTEPSEFGILRANAGSPPAPDQLFELWRRGFIGEAKVDEGLRFGRLRDEWIPTLKHLKDTRLSSSEAVDAWLRGHISEGDAETILKANGLVASDVPAALANAGNPLALGQLLEALRRGFIDEERFTRGFRQSRYRDEWAPIARDLAYTPMSTSEAIEASIQSYISKDAAREVARLNGLRAKDFDPLWDIAGSPLSRTELEALYNRGLIGAAEVEQGLRESRMKDKYVKAALQLRVRMPQPREVVTALTEGVITRHQAETWLSGEGYEPGVVAMLIATGEARSTGPHRQLATAQVQALYSDRIITETQATEFLTELHYTPASVGLILGLADYLRHHKILTTGIAGIRAHYLAGRITEAVAVSDLLALGLPKDARDTYLTVWRLEKLDHPKQLTAAQIVKAATKGLLVPSDGADPAAAAAANRDAGAARLAALGYDDTDAGLLLDGA